MRKYRFLVFVLTCILGWGFYALSACSPSSDGDGDGDIDADSDADSDGDGDGDGDGDTDIDADFDYDYDNTCDNQEFSISTEPPRIMILLDQSSSMLESNWGGHSHWSETVAGLEALLTDPRNAEAYFGLDPFPDGDLAYLERCHDTCCQDPVCFTNNWNRCFNLATSCNRSCDVDLPPWVSIDLAPISGPDIIEYVNLEWVPTSFGLTPITDQLRYYLEDHSATMPEFYANDGSAYLVVLSDGDDTCEGDDDTPVTEIEAALADVTSRLVSERGIRTFAIGFGDTSGDMARELNAIASNGGTPHTTFFPITEEGALLEAFDSISTSVISCEYDIDEPDATADPAAVNFYFDGDVVPMDVACENGWRWVDGSHMRVEFCAAYCDRLKNGDVSQIEARFGCSTILY